MTFESAARPAYFLVSITHLTVSYTNMSDVGLIIVGIVLAVIGYCVERFFTGIISTLGKLVFIVGVVLFVIGLVLLVVHLISTELMILPQLMLA